jgi:polar amino acid transport system substrate-binding protein
MTDGADPMTLSPDIIRAFTPAGKLRASINTGNPVLAAPDGASAKGVSVDLARGFAERLGVDLELVVFDTAAKSVDAVMQEQADIGFFAIDPKRGEGIRFTPPYVLIEGWYAVRNASPLKAVEEVDRAGTSVMVGKGSAYDLFLSRELKSANILRASTSAGVLESFFAENADVAAGVKQQLEAEVARVGGMRMLPGRFMVIQQAMGCPRGRGAEAADVLAAYVEDMKRSGFVAQALARHGISGAAVAPAS